MNIQIINPITDNYLDSRFQSVLLPFRCFQHMMFLSCFSIMYNRIRPHRASYYVVSLIAILGSIYFHASNISSFDYSEVANPYMFIFLKVHVFLIGFPLSFFYVLNIIQRRDHVRLILEIQKAFRLINFKQYKKAANRNWFAVLKYSLILILSVALTRELILVVYLYTTLFFDVILLYGCSIIALLRVGIDSWKAEVEFYSQMCLELEEEKYDDKLNRLFQAYGDLMEAFQIFKKIFKFIVSSDYCKVSFACQVKETLCSVNPLQSRIASLF